MNEGEDQHLTVKLRRQRHVSLQMLRRLWPTAVYQIYDVAFMRAIIRQDPKTKR